MQESIIENLITELKNIAPEIDTLMPNKDIRDQVDLDSIDYLRFINSINKKFELQIPEKDYSKLQTLQDFEQYILKASGH